MVTVLQRQQVSKRPASPVAVPLRSWRSGGFFSRVHLRVTTTGVRWSTRDLPVVRQPSSRSVLRSQTPRRLRLLRRPDARRFLKNQLPSRLRRRDGRKGLLRAGVAAIRDRFRGAPGWILLALACAAGAAVLLGALGPAVMPLAQPRPAFPIAAEFDQALYDLIVPRADAAPAFAVSPVLMDALKITPYKTKAGDSVSKIAAKFKLRIDTVVSWNGLRDARNLSAGSSLDIPNRDGIRYVVRRGDSLRGIARSAGVEFNGILDANMLRSSVITVGQQLFLPDARMNPSELSRILGSLFMYPVRGRISSPFGERPNPFSGIETYHNGVDIASMLGTPVLAAMAGTVAGVGFNTTYGNYVIIKHSSVYQTLYGHMSRSSVSKGQKVEQGQKIGELGATGVVTGPHLHFSIFRSGQPVDPLRFLK